MRPPRHTRSIQIIRADALFASTLQRCDDCSADQIRRVIAQTINAYGGRGGAAVVAIPEDHEQIRSTSTLVPSLRSGSS